MERITCPYCEYPYNEGSHIPMYLVCGHTICKSCINDLKLYFVTCPFDNERVNFKEPKINESVLKLIKNLCKVHYRPIIGYCAVYLQSLCDSCPTAINNSRIVKGSLNYLNNTLESEYVSSNLTVLTLQDTINDLNLTEFYDLLIIRFNKFNQANEISYELSRAENDRDIKIEILRDAGENLKKSIEDVKFIKKSMKKISAKQRSFEKYLKKKFTRNARTLMDEVKALRIHSNVLMYLANYSIHKSVFSNLTYIATFSQIYFDDWLFNCIGIGKCTTLGEKLRILNIELMIDGVLIWKTQDLELVNDNNEALACLLAIPTYNLKKNCELYINLEIQDSERFMFFNPVLDDCVKMTIYNESQEFPVAYLGYILIKDC